MQLRGQEPLQHQRAALVCAPRAEARPQRQVSHGQKCQTRSARVRNQDGGRGGRRGQRKTAQVDGVGHHEVQETRGVSWPHRKAEVGHRSGASSKLSQAHFARAIRRHQGRSHVVPSDHKRSARAEGMVSEGAHLVVACSSGVSKSVRTTSRTESHRVTEPHAECGAEGGVSHHRGAARRSDQPIARAWAFIAKAGPARRSGVGGAHVAAESKTAPKISSCCWRCCKWRQSPTACVMVFCEGCASPSLFVQSNPPFP